MKKIACRILLLLLLHCLLSNLLWAQTGSSTISTDIPKIVPASPNAAAIEKFGTVPVDYATGIPSISYPMWNWQRGKLSLSLSLSYHAGGHKVQDMASNVGLGWSLSLGGRISRTVRGLTDDDYLKGFMYTAPLPPVFTSQYQATNYYPTSLFSSVRQGMSTFQVINDVNSTYSYTVAQLVNKELDAEQDIFSFSFGGYSGRFVISKGKNIIPLEPTNCKIEMSCHPTTLPNSTAGNIKSFIVTADNGLRYFFEQGEYSNSQTYTIPGAAQAFLVQNPVSSWLLTKVLDPQTKDSVVYTYATNLNGGGVFETGFGESETFDITKCVPGSGGSTSFEVSEHSFFHSSVMTEDLMPSAIYLPDGSTVLFESNFSRDDFYGCKALTRVMVKNMKGDTVKQFKLDYSYFLSSTPAVRGYAQSQNDYSKRLRLDSASELSQDGLQRKTTKFTYNPYELNARDSRNIDYWGYNVNPFRSNSSFLPSVPLESTEAAVAQQRGLYLPGSDRKPDPLFVKAAILEKITYPTGGYTEFDFEANKAFSLVNYFENKLTSNTAEWFQNGFGGDRDLDMGERTGGTIELNLQSVEFNSRPPYDPNGFNACLENEQDSKGWSIDIFSTDASFTTTVQGTYGQLTGFGTKRIIALPLNKVYKIRFNYNSQASCAYSFPFKMLATADYYVTPQDKLAGGVRIKTITSHDGYGKTLQKSYRYDSAGRSSATLGVIPNFGYYRFVKEHSAPMGGIVCESHHLKRTGSPVQSLNFHNGSPLLYRHVKEIEADSSITERVYDPIVSEASKADYPYTSGQDFPNLSGLLIKETVKTATGVTKTEKTFSYNKSITKLQNDSLKSLTIGSVGSGVNYTATNYVVEPFYPSVTYAELIADTTRVFEGLGAVTQIQNRTYDPVTHYPRTVKGTNSKGQEIETTYAYPYDFSTTAFSVMTTRNDIKPAVVETRQQTSGGGVQLSQTKLNYGLWGSQNIAQPLNAEASLGSATLTTVLTYDVYDEKGNVLQYTGKDGVVTSFIWGYQRQYPVAKIIGKSYSDVVSQSGINLSVINDPQSELSMQTELNYLQALPNCLVTTYTYKPLVGPLSETDPSGKTIRYEYDSYNRLSLIRDKDNNILKMFCYKYDGQPYDCNGLRYENVSVSGAYTKSCGTGYTSSPITYTVPSGKYTSTISQADADQKAQADLSANGQAYTNQQGVCTPASSCNTSNCSGNDKKCINGVCETGTKVCTSSVRVPGSGWVTTYHYVWSDNSVSPDYQESGIGCLILE